MSASSNFGREPFGLGWWWGVWQDDRLVGFGAGYRDKRRCFKHEAACLKLAKSARLETMQCANPAIRPRSLAPSTPPA